MKYSGFIYEEIDERSVDYQELVARFSQVDLDLREIIHSSFDNVFITDSEGRIIFQNAASERMLGFCNLWPGSMSVQDCVAMGIYDVSTALEAIKTRKRVSGLVMSSHGFALMSTSTPLFDERGTIRLVLTNARDRGIVDQFLTRMLESEREEKSRLQSLATYLGGLSSGDSPVMMSHNRTMQGILDFAKAVAPSDSTVLLTGESGTGKDVVARFIHHESNRRELPFIPVNCAAIPRELLESEFFGHEKGAFTGAWHEKPGIFELADRGTLFLDEVGDLPLHLQSKLLRALESGEIQRLGSTKTLKVSPRIIAASNKDLYKMVRQGLFREDLFYRLNVIPILLPPLRERKDDVLHFAHHFLNEVGKKNGQTKTLSPQAAALLRDYPWPGNIRELRNIIERLMVIAPGRVIGYDVCRGVLSPFGALSDDPSAPPVMRAGPIPPSIPQSLKTVKERAEAEYLRSIYPLYKSNISAMAKALGVHRTGLHRKLAALGLHCPSGETGYNAVSPVMQPPESMDDRAPSG